MTEIKLPELGEGISLVEISDVLVKTGDNIKLDDPLIVVETEKASMEIPSTTSGTVSKIYVIINLIVRCIISFKRERFAIFISKNC